MKPRERLIRICIVSFVLFLLIPALDVGAQPTHTRLTSLGGNPIYIETQVIPDLGPGFRVSLVWADEIEPYVLEVPLASLQDIQLVRLRDDLRTEVLISWRLSGSGGYMGYALVAATDSGFESLIRVDDALHGTLDIRYGTLVETRLAYRKDSAWLQPAEKIVTTWRWDGYEFSSDVDAHVLVSPAEVQRMPLAQIDPVIDELITRKSLEFDVPPVIVKAIALVESGGRHWTTDGSVIRGSSGEIGLMQVMPDTNLFTYEEISRLEDLEFNIEAGVRILLDKKMYTGYVIPWFSEPYCLTQINMDDDILESWYFAIWAYNGWAQSNNPGYVAPGVRTYQDKVIDYVISFGQDMKRPPASSFSASLPQAQDVFALPGKTNASLRPLYTGTVLSVFNTTELRIRQQPGMVFEVLGSLPAGTQVVALQGPHTATRCRWYNVMLPGGPVLGWAAHAFKEIPNSLQHVYYLRRTFSSADGTVSLQGGKAPQDLSIWISEAPTQLHPSLDGTYALSGVRAGEWVVAHHPGFLKQALSIPHWVRGPHYLSFAEMILPAGDIDGNNVVDTRDLALLATAYKQQFGCAGYDPSFDLNADGVIDLYDMVLAGRNLGLLGFHD